MEMIETKQNAKIETRAEFKAQLKAAIALTLQLQQKLLQWGDRMEQRSKH